MLCGLVMVALFAVAITFFGYEMTNADVPVVAVLAFTAYSSAFA
ncbi:MAG: hypothetical protein R2788_21695 [Saprospiraceae bacterium]